MNVKIIMFALVFMAWVLIISQIIVPLVKKRKLFPMFNSRRRELAKREVDANEENDVINIESKLVKSKKQSKKQGGKIMKKQIGNVQVNLVLMVCSLLLATFLAITAFEVIDANEILITQDRGDGELHYFSTAGTEWVGIAKATSYARRSQYNFDTQGDKDLSKKIGFNDGGTAQIYGSVSWEMPLDADSLRKIHTSFGSTESVEQQVVAKMVDNAIYFSGPMMSSTESNAERKAELINLIYDQAENGVYATHSKTETVDDPTSTGGKRTVTTVEIIRDSSGNPKRQQKSTLKDLNIKLLPISISHIEYDERVKKQISDRQQSITAVQTAIANAKRAEQDAITAEKEGEASAAKAKWAQETINAKEIALAEKNLRIAELDAKRAAQYKLEQTLIGEGNAAKMAAEMQANGALDQKLEAYKAVNKMWADALANFKGQLVPNYVGGGGSSNVNGNDQFQQFMQLTTMKAAKDLGIDMSVKK